MNDCKVSSRMIAGYNEKIDLPPKDNSRTIQLEFVCNVEPLEDDPDMPERYCTTLVGLKVDGKPVWEGFRAQSQESDPDVALEDLLQYLATEMRTSRFLKDPY